MTVSALTKTRDNSGVSPEGYAIGSDDHTDLNMLRTWAVAHEAASNPHTGYVTSDSPTFTGSPTAAGATWVGLGAVKAMEIYRTATAISADVLATQFYIGVTDTSAARTLTILTASMVAGHVWIIADESGGAGLTPITIVGEAGETFSGATSVQITEDNGVMVLYVTSATTIQILQS